MEPSKEMMQAAINFLKVDAFRPCADGQTQEVNGVALTRMQLADRIHAVLYPHRTSSLLESTLERNSAAPAATYGGLVSAPAPVAAPAQDQTDDADSLSFARRAGDAYRWQALMELAGSLQDGSQTTVTLTQDDATRTAFIRVGEVSYYVEGGGFDSAMSVAVQALEAQKS